MKIILIAHIIFLAIQLSFVYSDPGSLTRYPVILIPGDGGNQIYAKLNKTSAIHYFCDLKSKDYFELWLNLEEITPYVIDCFVENLKLTIKNDSNQTYNADGVDIQIKGFGTTDTVEYLDSSKLSISILSLFINSFNSRVLNLCF